MTTMARTARTGIICLILTGLSCALPQAVEHPASSDAVPRPEHPSSFPGKKILAAAMAMIGRPYHFSGDNPLGFDCSGLVRYAYLAAGIDVPHSTGELKQMTRVVGLCEMRAGDLVFFDQNGRGYSHVGIYAGRSQFVHAPGAGKAVRVDSLLDPFWKEHFLDARRL